jgi:hypothetical protein
MIQELRSVSLMTRRGRAITSQKGIIIFRKDIEGALGALEKERTRERKSMKEIERDSSDRIRCEQILSKEKLGWVVLPAAPTCSHR